MIRCRCVVEGSFGDDCCCEREEGILHLGRYIYMYIGDLVIYLVLQV